MTGGRYQSQLHESIWFRSRSTQILTAYWHNSVVGLVIYGVLTYNVPLPEA